MAVMSCSAMAMAEKISCYSSLLLALMLVLSCYKLPSKETDQFSGGITEGDEWTNNFKVVSAKKQPCDDIYVVREGETLQTIIDKCGDPYIVENNPHIHDPDDVFPGFLIKITPLS